MSFLSFSFYPFAKVFRWLLQKTELGHGSNVRGLETTATFIPETDEFDVHSPTLTSTKWWPGGMGKTANYAVVYARLILPAGDQGIHPFLVQLRSLEDHSVRYSF